MDIQHHWPEILEVIANARKSNGFFSIATVDPEGNPHITPNGFSPATYPVMCEELWGG